MVPKDYEKVSEGVYESDAFVTSRPTIDSSRIRQILNEQRSPAGNQDDSSSPVSAWDREHTEQEADKCGSV